MSATLIYMTAADRDEARRIGRTLVEERLAACVNLLGAIDSIYWWDGAVQSGTETALIAKTQTGKIAALVARVRELHSYECPCVVALPIHDGNPDFLQWIESETAQGAQPNNGGES